MPEASRCRSEVRPQMAAHFPMQNVEKYPVQNFLRDRLARQLTQGTQGFPEVEGDELR